MAISAKMYGNALLKALNKEINFSTDVIKVSLHTSAYVPDQDTHIYQSSLTNEVSGTGYTAGGIALASKTINYDSATNSIKLDAADISWPASTITARFAVIYDATPGTTATNPLLGYVDFGTDMISSNGTFAIVWDSAGIFTITAA